MRSIGASEAAAAAGVHPRKKRITLWQELLGMAPPFEGNVHTEWGLRLEPIVQQKYAESHGAMLVTNPDPVYRDGWKRASPDAFVYAQAEHPGETATVVRGLEVKCPEWRDGDRWGEPGTDDVPTEYLVQCVWSMHVTGLPRWDLAALIGAHDYREFPIHQDAELEGLLVQEVERFWVDHVLTGEPPDPDGSTEYARFQAQRHKTIRNHFVRADGSTAALLRDLRDAKCRARQAEADIAKAEQWIRTVIGEAAGIEYLDGKETVRLTCRVRAGRTLIDWDALCGELVAKGVVRQEHLNSLLTTYSRKGAPSRPLLTPQSWSRDVHSTVFVPSVFSPPKES